MSDHNNPAGGTLSVDFDWVSRVFTRLKPVAALATTIQEFASIAQGGTSEVSLKYFEVSTAQLHKLEDIQRLTPHVTDCINNIMPQHLSYKAVSVILPDGRPQLQFHPKQKDETKTKLH